MATYVRRSDGTTVSIFYLTLDAIPMAFPASITEAEVISIAESYASQGHTVVMLSHLTRDQNYPRTF